MFHIAMLIAPLALGAPDAGPRADLAPVVPAQFKSLTGKKDKAEAATGPLTYAMIEGTWEGTVNEVGLDPYTLTMSFDAHGLGEVAYPAYYCSGILAPLSEGDQLRFREIVAVGRENCADGTVLIGLDGAMMSWTWLNEDGGVQATGTLERK